ncbi:MAG: hypothetical protein IJ741_08820 [Schwartzia sp.]|nr:hypothetical protein [Schwartzia sp. (in: firmicutes)]
MKKIVDNQKTGIYPHCGQNLWKIRNDIWEASHKEAWRKGKKKPKPPSGEAERRFWLKGDTMKNKKGR